MCSRSLTDVFILMRNNAVQSRHIYAEQTMSDHVRLLYDESSSSARLRSVDVEGGLSGSRGVRRRGSSVGEGACLPPAWADSLEEAQYIMTRLRTKISELTEVHRKHVQRPTLDDSCTEEVAAGRLTSEISRHFTTAHRLVQVIKGQCRQGTTLEQRLTANVLSSLVTTLQELSFTFRSAQNNYLKSLTSREERSNAFFEIPNFDDINIDDGSNYLDMTSAMLHKHNPESFGEGPSSSQPPKNSKNSSIFFEEEDQDIDEVFQKPANSRMSQQQMLLYEEDNTKLALHREQEVNKIVRSIVELNDVFKDLSQMVQDQGTILDRIDYNIEQTQVSVFEGFKQLQKADAYHRKNRKMHCIFVLGSTIIVLLVLLMIVKS